MNDPLFDLDTTAPGQWGAPAAPVCRCGTKARYYWVDEHRYYCPACWWNGPGK